MTRERITGILEELFDEAMSHKPIPTYPKIGTIKAMVDLGEGWHHYSEIQRELGKFHKTGNVYTFYLARHFPELIEIDNQKRARIRPEAFTLVRKIVGRHAKQILQAKRKAAIVPGG